MEQQNKELTELLPQGVKLKVGKFEVMAKPFSANDWALIISRFKNPEAIDLNDIAAMRFFLWLLIRKDERYRNISEEDVGEEFTLRDIPELWPIVEQLMAESLPQGVLDEQKKEQNFPGRQSLPSSRKISAGRHNKSGS